MRETPNIRAGATGIFCGTLFWLGMLLTHGSAVEEWHASYLLVSTGTLLGPLALVAWSVIATPDRRSRTLRWTKRFILFHWMWGIALLFLAGCDRVDLIGVPNKFGDGIGALGTVVVFIDLMLLALIPKPEAATETLRIYRKVFLAIAGGALFATTVWPVAVIGLVVAQAEIIAFGRPYCIQVAGNGPHGYRTVRSLSEMNGLKMYAPWSPGNTMDFQMEFHAVLIVEPGDMALAWWNWSYYRERFVPIPAQTRQALYLLGPACSPQAHFVWQLPL